jgi:hypothetical protein
MDRPNEPRVPLVRAALLRPGAPSGRITAVTLINYALVGICGAALGFTS